MTVNKNTALIYESPLLNEKYKKIKSDCGLNVYIYPKEMSTAYALFGVKYGSVNNSFTDAKGKNITVPDGIAHFLEHKLFFNEDGSDSFERFSEYGADANAYTSFNKTAYLFSCVGDITASLGELIDFVTHPYFTKESVESEIGIISEEIKMYDDSPSDRCFYGMLEGMYENHSIRRNICGSEQSISEISADTLYECYNAFYRPHNMSLIICGNVCTDKILDTVQKHIPKSFIGHSVKCVNENIGEPQYVFKKYVERQMNVSKPIFNIGFKDTAIPQNPYERQKKDAVMSVLDEMLFSRSGKFYSSLFEEALISPSMSYGYTISESFAYHSIAGEADDPYLILQKTLDYISYVKENGLGITDFENAKRVMYAEAVKLFDSTESIANTMFSFICEGYELFEYVELLRNITFDDVVREFSQAFNEETVTLSVINPINKKTTEV